MSVRRVQKSGVGTKGGIGARLAAVLSIGAPGDGDDGRKRQRTSMFEYETEYEGTVKSETVMSRSYRSLSSPAVERTEYYVEMDGVDEKFYFCNKRAHDLEASTTHTLEANFNGTVYRFIDGMVTRSSLPALDPVFPPGTRVLFKPIAAHFFREDGILHMWSVRGGKAATMIKQIDEAAASSHTTVRAEGEDEKSALDKVPEVHEGLKAIKIFYDGALISIEEYETKKKELLGRI